MDPAETAGRDQVRAHVRAAFDQAAREVSDPTSTLVAMNDDDRTLLAIEAKFWTHRGPKVQAIREQLGISETVYYARLLRLLDDPDALRAEPVLVNRLRRVRDARRGRRAG